MSLLPNTPFILKLLYTFCGSVQFPLSTSPVSKFENFFRRGLCHLIYAIYYFTFIDYANKIFLQYSLLFVIGNVLQNFIFIFYVSASYLCFIKRSKKIRLCLVNLHKFNCESELISSSIRKWWRIIFSGSYILTSVPFFLYSFHIKYIICITYPSTIHFVETLFLNDILNLIFLKFQAINHRMQFQTGIKFSHRPFVLVQNKQSAISKNIEQIENLSQIYCSLVEVTNEIIKHISVNLLLSFLFWFECLVLSIYYFLSMIAIEVKELGRFSSILIYIIYASFWIFMVINSFTQIQTEARKTISYIHEIWNKYTLKGKINREIRHFELISIRLYYNKVELNVNSFFNLDWAFCHVVPTKQ